MTVSCSNPVKRNDGSPSQDPFIGYFAHPSDGGIELQPGKTKGTYRGEMWADFGPFPVELTREGDVARGTVEYGGASHPLQVQHTPEGLVVTVDNIPFKAPFRRFPNQKAYENWYQSQSDGF